MFKKYLKASDRFELIKDIQSGVLLVKNAQGKIVQQRNKAPFVDKCSVMDILKKLTDVSELGAGSYGEAFKVCTPKEVCENNTNSHTTLSYSIKEIPFNNKLTYNPSIDNPDRYENADIRVLQFLSSFVTQSATPHINLPIMSWVCVPSPHLSSRIDNKSGPRRYTVSELADYGDLHSFIAFNYKKWTTRPMIWKIISFQILYTLAVIHKYFPNFLHNDFKPDNILVRSTNPITLSRVGSQMIDESIQSNEYFVYKFGDETFYIPDIGFQLLLWDFDFSTIAGKIENDKVLLMIGEKDANLTMHKNQYYDIGMCFGLFKRLFGDHFPDEIADWINDEVLNQDILTSSRNERVLEAIEFTTPTKLLGSSIFDEFKSKPIGIVKDIFNGKIYKQFQFKGSKSHRYILPDTCQFGNYIYLVPKKITKNEKKRLQHRLKCKMSTSKDERISKLSEQQYTRFQEWMDDIFSDSEVMNAVTLDEAADIQELALKHLRLFDKEYYLSSSTLYLVLCSAIMYASYRTILAYIYPFNTYSWWMDKPKISDHSRDILIDIFKQYCKFIAIHIE